MSYFEATLHDWWRKKRKRENPHQSLLSNARGPRKGPERTVHQLPDPGLVTDPMLDWGKAQEAFHSWQVSEGCGIIGNGQGINTAADEQNVRAAKDDVHNASHDPTLTPAPQPAVMKPFDQQRFVEPHNNPFGTVPGGMGFGPLTPPGGFPPGM